MVKNLKGHSLATYLYFAYDDEPKGLYDALSAFTDKLVKFPHGYAAQRNENYDVDVNKMLRVTIAPFLGKEAQLKALAERFGVSVNLTMIARLSESSKAPSPILSLDKDIVEFLYLSGAEEDLDLYLMP